MPGQPILKVNEVFYSVQGEGHWTGLAAEFIRFAGCNLACSWCDTKYARETKYEMTPHELVKQATSVALPRAVVLTGGEPTIQDEDAMLKLCRMLKEKKVRIHVETNGTRYAEWLGLADWLTVSPKRDGTLAASVVDASSELKLVYDRHSVAELRAFESRFAGKELFLQPRSSLDEEVCKCVQIVKGRPEWRLSIQVHRLLGLR